jgi:DnaK suppressor protein
MVDVRDNGDISQLADHNGLFVRDSGEAVKSRQLYREHRLTPCFLPLAVASPSGKGLADMYKAEEIAAIKARLLQLQLELQGLKDAGEDAASVVELDQTSVGRLSRMDALQGQAMSKETGRRRQLEMQKIAAALRRIDSGDYGYCLSCEEPIARERLALDPAATLCIACANKKEQT